MSPMSLDHEAEWPHLRSLAESGDSAAILDRIRAVEDDGERISLYRFTIRKLAFDEWKNKSLDVMTAITDAAIGDCEELGGDYLQQANVILFNSSANLADCWADSFPREPRHFEKGIEYAKKALWYRDHLGKGPGPKAMATWALGKHQQSLGRLEEAKETFRRCLELETEAAAEAGKPAEISAEAPNGYLIAAGYVALMEKNGADLAKLKGILDEMIAHGGDPKDDAEIILGQMVETARHLDLRF
ncbi:MAG: hypothetical protein ACHQ50_16265 [Fimbriimonadales bacterium]